MGTLFPKALERKCGADEQSSIHSKTIAVFGPFAVCAGEGRRRSQRLRVSSAMLAGLQVQRQNRIWRLLSPSIEPMNADQAAPFGERLIAVPASTQSIKSYLWVVGGSIRRKPSLTNDDGFSL
jgi:hypothetical protein